MEKKVVKKVELKEEELSKVVGGTTAYAGINLIKKGWKLRFPWNK